MLEKLGLEELSETVLKMSKARTHQFLILYSLQIITFIFLVVIAFKISQIPERVIKEVQACELSKKTMP